jgi:hypothetical protein
VFALNFLLKSFFFSFFLSIYIYISKLFFYLKKKNPNNTKKKKKKITITTHAQLFYSFATFDNQKLITFDSFATFHK